MIVYSNSCSFGEPGQGHEVYADHVADYFKAELINRGQAGSCNRRIIRTTLRDLIEYGSNDVVVLLGLTFISRTELWQPWLPATVNDGHFHSITVDHQKINWSIKGLIDTIVPDIHQLADARIKDYYKQWLSHYDREAEVTNLLTDIIMLTGWMQSRSIPYIIFSNVDVLPDSDLVGYNSPFISSLQETIRADNSILDLWKFSFGTYSLENGFIPKDYDLYKHHGHPGGDAHKFFGNYLITNLNERYFNKEIR